MAAYKAYFKKYPDRIGKDVLYQVRVSGLENPVDLYYDLSSGLFRQHIC
ncbi:unnamed protein product [Anisakis simplex]|uniref:Lipoprotein n=1 Tax=Anisakis simplex TaxID=6269 RepID=A0A0M3JJL6_ANISI|nr:unnamed protein product [Anisakis simplex]